MTHEVVFLARAESDLGDLFDYIAEQSSATQAQRYVGRIEDMCAGLAHFPNRGVPRDDLEAGLRTISFERRAVIAYRVEGNRVFIVRIFAAGRDFERELADADN